MCPDDIMETPAGGEERDFWWTVEFELRASENPAWDEEILADLAELTGVLGSEILDEPGLRVLRAAYRASLPIDELMSGLREAAEPFGVKVRGYSRTRKQAWHTQHLDAFPPLEAGKRFVVMAPWHKGKEPEGRLPLYIYPAAAFGTGYHESTQIALELLEDAVQEGDTVIDVGTGTGILFIAALKLGASRAVARDIDPTALGEVRRNMGLNGLDEGLCDLAAGDLLKGVNARGDVLTANILLAPNLALLPDVKRVLNPGGRAVFSGMTEKERAVFLPALTQAGLSVEKEWVRGEWWGCRARPAGA